jgi:hypothetical protein
MLWRKESRLHPGFRTLCFKKLISLIHELATAMSCRMGTMSIKGLIEFLGSPLYLLGRSISHWITKMLFPARRRDLGKCGTQSADRATLMAERLSDRKEFSASYSAEQRDPSGGSISTYSTVPSMDSPQVHSALPRRQQAFERSRCLPVRCDHINSKLRRTCRCGNATCTRILTSHHLLKISNTK